MTSNKDEVEEKSDKIEENKEEKKDENKNEDKNDEVFDENQKAPIPNGDVFVPAIKKEPPSPSVQKKETTDVSTITLFQTKGFLNSSTCFGQAPLESKL